MKRLVSEIVGVALWAMLLVAGGCANRGIGPQGGPKDTVPPHVLKETPANGSVSFTGKEIEIAFDEYLQLDNVQANLLVSPPQQVPPEVKAIGKKVKIVLQEDLQDSTTYTLDFGNAICDYTEKNPISGYQFAFATGSHIDSLEVYGLVVNAEDLNPVSGLMVGLQSNPDDSAFTTIPFTRVARTDSTGAFAIRNLRGGDYRLYALQDVSRDFLYQPGEGLAFADSLVTPLYEVEVVEDTLWRDTIILDVYGRDTMATRVGDSIRIVENTYVGPSDLLLWFFHEAKTRLYFQRLYREERHLLRLVFSAPQDSLPQITALPPSAMDSLASDSAWVNPLDYALLQVNTTRDTLVYWLTDSVAMRQDSIYLRMTYLKSDSVYQLVPQTDTIGAIYRAPRLSAKAKEALEKKARERKLNLRSNAKGAFEAYDTLCIYSPMPIAAICADSLHLYEKVDTLLKPQTFVLQPADSVPMDYRLLARLEQGKSYELHIDSAAVRDIYGVVNDAQKFSLKLKTAEDYSTLLIRLPDYDPRIRLQLLNEKDQPVRELPALPDGTKFEYLAPKTYYLRMYIDDNGDGKWTTGDWQTKRQPEQVYYFPYKLTLRANWDFEELFDYLGRPQLDAKPQELRKDAGAAKK
ncbi:MAG: Ig-like domain-containing protein [Paludibacteraceae bacterium]